MSKQSASTGSASTGSAASPAQLAQEIKLTRQQLGDAVQQLAAEADVRWQHGKRVGQRAIAIAAAGAFAAIACVLLVRWRAGR
jgi:hypothetical protein